MADRGYDVWLGNVRGNTYGRQHVNISPDDRAFWEFTFDDFIAIDVPTMIDYILEKTGIAADCVSASNSTAIASTFYYRLYGA
ncbi:gastric triacylglycerol lipase-like [Tropilaelaps mercedesae]|uniref:Gastric triacylglycerol lipase-like n=1 Tax=Tropilaelaps mercedesae TaxID=418985 RepID=A0A1V9X1V2_9ACAR|nr:gastric triacylglycerol lipase-like [Tropilaelaps mercedesae]